MNALVWLVRYGIALALILTGQVMLVAAEPTVRPEAWAGFTGAGLAVLLLNTLFRIGVQGDRDREREEDARRYFDEHGSWPDQPPPRRS